MTEPRKLRVFLCHASQDKPIVRELYQRLLAEGWIDPWLDKEKLLIGQDFDLEIEKAIEESDAVVVCITKNAVRKVGYIQKELRLIYNAAMFRPEEMLFTIPLRLEECEPPSRFNLWHWGDYFGDEKEKTYGLLLKSLGVIYEQKMQIEVERKTNGEIEALIRKDKEGKDTENYVPFQAKEKGQVQVYIPSINQPPVSKETKKLIEPVKSTQNKFANENNDLDSSALAQSQKKGNTTDAKLSKPLSVTKSFAAILISIVIGVIFIINFQVKYSDSNPWFVWVLVIGFVGIGNFAAAVLGENSYNNFNIGINLIALSLVLVSITANFAGWNLLGNYGPLFTFISIGLYIVARVFLYIWRKK